LRRADSSPSSSLEEEEEGGDAIDSDAADYELAYLSGGKRKTKSSSSEL